MTHKLQPRGLPSSVLNEPVFQSYLNEEKLGETFDHLVAYVKSIADRAGITGKVLDLGCGFGLHSMVLQECADTLVSVDVDLRKIHILNRIKRALLGTKVAPLVASATNLPFRDSSFNAVYMNETISHVPDIERTVREIKRTIGKQGILVVADTGKWSWYGIFMRFKKTDENYFTLRRMKKILKDAGFQSVNRVTHVGAARNPFKNENSILWHLVALIDPKYVVRAIV